MAAGGRADTLVGGFGRDVILGNQGNDFLLGNQGDDVLYGNEGLNTFVFAPGDTDFRSGVGTGDTVADLTTESSRIDFASGPVGTASDFVPARTTSTDFAQIQALAQTLLTGSVS